MSPAIPDQPIICFPSNLRENDGTKNGGYPQISFTVQSSPKEGRMFKTIYLPLPQGISFGENGEYSSVDLGPLAGSGLQDSLTSLLHGDIAGAASGAGGVLNQIKNLKFMEAAAILSSKIPYVGEAGKEKAMFALKKITAPNTNTTFTKNSIRDFMFSFSMIARTKEDTRAINSIHKIFRRYTYAGADSGSPNIILDYPPVWKIQFLIDGVDNPYIPKLFSCYLKGLSTTFNPSTHSIRTDGSPHEISIQLSFQESRVLTRRDIDDLELGISDRGIDEKTGLASS